MLSADLRSPVLMTKRYTYPVEKQAVSFKGKQNIEASCTGNPKYASGSDSIF